MLAVAAVFLLSVPHARTVGTALAVVAVAGFLSVAVMIGRSVLHREAVERTVHIESSALEPLIPQPPVVFTAPGRTAGVDDAVPQQQLRQSLPGTVQVGPGGVAGPDQITGGFLLDRRHVDRDDVAHPDQPGELEGVLLVVFHPVSRRPLQFRRCSDLARDLLGGQIPIQPIAGRAGGRPVSRTIAETPMLARHRCDGTTMSRGVADQACLSCLVR